jgi:predicted DNA binding protein
MLYAQTVMTPPDGGLTPFERELVSEPTLDNRRIYNINVLNDGTLLTLTQLSGDAEIVRELARANPEILNYRIEPRNDELYVYIKSEATEILVDLLSVFNNHRLLLNPPIEHVDSGRHQTHLVGTETAFQQAAMAVPDELSIELEELSEYPLERDRLRSLLTETQLDTLQAALELGYYQVPREATYEDIAASLDRSKGTVGEHLRKIEAKMMHHLVP